MLADMGHQVEPMADGASMIGKLEAAPDGYDLIVTDYAMPVASGADVLKQARAIRPDMPGIIISGYADRSAMTNRPSEVVVLTKPFTLEQMRTAICAVMPAAEGRAAAG